MGAKRLAGIRDSLAARLARVRPPVLPLPTPGAPPVEELLDVDREYREGAESGKLRRIAPRRFNPTREAWLPVLRTSRGERRYTALFSNTAMAHRAGRTHDWVVIYDEGPRTAGRSWTVITSRRGPLNGQRIVRGREEECLAATRAQPVDTLHPQAA